MAMTRCFLLLVLLIGAGAAWNYETGYDSHPWQLQNQWMKRSETTELPQPAVRENAINNGYIHKRGEEKKELPQPAVRKNAINNGYIHRKRSGVFDYYFV